MAAGDSTAVFFRGGEPVATHSFDSANLYQEIRSVTDAEYCIVTAPTVRSGAATYFGLTTSEIRAPTADESRGLKFKGPDTRLP